MRIWPSFCILGICLMLTVGCSSPLEPHKDPKPFKGSFSTAGLEKFNINSFNAFKGSIYAATDHGLFKQKPTGTAWTSLGLQQESVLNVVFLPGNKLLAAIRISDSAGGIPSLFLSADQGQNWRPYMGNYGGETGKYTRAASLASNSKPSDTIFARVDGLTVARSTNGGNSWKAVNENWDGYGGAAVLVKADPYHKQRIWAG